ncbi:MAG: glycosyltransferase family 1 protein [Opitutaceae bacterium]|nr:glycosyltransferase family 1 protein [Opitutaceae bacterium]
MKAVVTGMIANYAVGGVAWDYAQYALALERLGFEVYYLEDTGEMPYNPEKGDVSEDYSYSLKFLEESLGLMSPALARRWRVVGFDGRGYGVDAKEFADVLREAALFLNVSGSALMRDEYVACRKKLIIDTDPGWNHFRNYPKWDASPGWQGTHGWRAHDVFFTYAQRLGRPGCALPDFGIRWFPTVPPVVRDCWETPAASGAGTEWTTILSWNTYAKGIEGNGRTYGAKELEFPKIERVPTRVPSARLAISIASHNAPRDAWRAHGWHIRDAHADSATVARYRDFITSSRGEISVAKNAYVDTRSGWFSCRSTCYLAAGRPTVVQDTGWTDFIPAGEGLLAFRDEAEAVAALGEVERDYPRHARAAREVAKKYFDHAVVLGDMLEKADVPLPR